ncbi:MAG TPA: SCP2 sterol-binding domain-containing protein [Candidatus Obscuribacterales bacterium]
MVIRMFSSTDELQAVMERLWKDISHDPSMSRSLLSSKLIVRFNFTEPDGQLMLDGSDGEELKVYVGQCSIAPDVEMDMKADVADEFWRGELNVPVALMQGRIKTTGPVHKALALIPAVKPAFSIYPDVVKSVKGKAA